MEFVNVVTQYGAIGNGTTDNWSAIQAALDHVGSVGGGDVFIPSGTYFLTKGLHVPSNVHLFGAGAATVLVNPPGDLPQLDVGGVRVYATIASVGTTGAHISDLTVDHATNGTTANGIQIGAESPSGISTNAVVERTTVEGFDSHQYLIFNMRGQDVIIRDNHVIGHAAGPAPTTYLQEGIEIFGGNNVQVYGNLVEGVRGAGILVHEDAATAAPDTAVNNITVHDNTVVGGAYGTDVTVYTTATGLLFYNNTLTNNSNRGIQIGVEAGGTLTGVIVRDNAINNAGEIGIVLDGVVATAQDVIITGNHINHTVNAGSTGIYLHNMNATVVGNTITDANYRGIFVEGVTTATLNGNIISNIGREAIYIDASSNVEASNNSLTGYGLFGLYSGIFAGNGSAHVEFVGNTLTPGNGPTTGETYAIHAYYATDATIHGNTLTYGPTIPVAFLTDASGINGPNVINDVAVQATVTGQQFSYQFSASKFLDADSGNGDVLTYGATAADGSALPSWLTFNATTRTFSSSGTPAGLGGIAVKVTAADTAGATASDIFTIVVDASLGLPLVYERGTVGYTGGAGSDTFDISSLGSAVRVDLAAVGVDVWTRDQPNLASGLERPLADLTNIENVTGTAFDDLLMGNASDNVLSGGAGNDTFAYRNGTGLDHFNGGTGNDTLDLSTLNSAVWANLSYSGAEVWTRDQPNLATGSYRAIIDLDGIENVIGTAFDDQITGDTNNNRLFGGAGNDTLIYRGGVDTLDGGIGSDTVDLSNYASGVRVDLAATSVDATTGSGQGLTTIAHLVAIENVVGTAFDDTLSGNANDNTLSGGAGNDTFVYRNGAGIDLFEGGTGTDTADLSSFGAAIWLDLTHNNEIETRDQPNLATGVYRDLVNLESVENVIGTAFDDYLAGDANANSLSGGAGNDTFVYRNGLGPDTMSGGTGTDTLDLSAYGSAVWANLSYSGAEVWTRDQPDLATGTYRAIIDLDGIENIVGTAYADNITGDANNNKISGGAGNDTLIYRGGLDTLDGGTGTDVADFSQATAAIRVDLASAINEVTTGAVQAQTAIANLESIESVIGTTFDDTMLGDAFDNALSGGGGADTFVYRAGAGLDRFNGDAGIDTVDMSGFGSAIWVNLDHNFEIETRDRPNLESGTYRAIVDLDSIENVVGTAFDDYLAGDANNNRLSGGAGQDTLIYRGGIDTLDGGTGVDVADFSEVSAAIRADLATTQNQVSTGIGLTTTVLATLLGIEDLIGTAFDDTLLANASDNTLTGGLGNDTFVFRSGAGLDHFYGGVGTDTVDMSAFAAAIWVNLNHNFEIETRDQPNLSTGLYRAIVDLDGVENVIGTAFDDYLAGDANNNQLTAGAGNDTLIYRGGLDTLDGGTGADVADFSELASGIRVDLAATQNEATTGSISNPTTVAHLVGIENIVGTAFDDVLLGDANENSLTGGLGNDTFVYRNGLGLDTFVGGSGTDIVDLSAFTSAVWGDLAYTNKEIWTRDAIDLTSSWGQPYRPIIDLESVENIRGSAFADTLLGNASDNLLVGGAGVDTLTGRGGADSFRFYRQDGGIDVITDFTTGVDQLQVVGFGTYAANAAVELLSGTGGAAGIFTGSGASFGYDTVSGAVYFSTDGTAASAVQFASLTAHPSLAVSDFHVIQNDLL
jgi:Ca2+-binding RTX toxin-like protein